MSVCAARHRVIGVDGESVVGCVCVATYGLYCAAHAWNPDLWPEDMNPEAEAQRGGSAARKAIAKAEDK
jgi:hypothetical protein